MIWVMNMCAYAAGGYLAMYGSYAVQAIAPGFVVSAWYAAVPSCGDFGARGFGALIQAVVASIAVN